MRPPVPGIDKIAVFLDFDGTLVDFAPAPEAVIVPSALKTQLHNLNSRLDGALALITGRSLESLDALIGNKALCAAGCHGAEWRALQAPEKEGAASNGEEALAKARVALAAFAKQHNLLLEGKPHSLALHFRTAPELEPVIDRWLEDNLVELAELRVIRGKCVREVQLAGIDKGVAVARFMQFPPFAGRIPVYLGDDVTDEDAFAWVNQADGIAIKVGSGDSVAPYRLLDYCEVSVWLEKLL